MLRPRKRAQRSADPRACRRSCVRGGDGAPPSRTPSAKRNHPKRWANRLSDIVRRSRIRRSIPASHRHPMSLSTLPTAKDALSNSWSGKLPASAFGIAPKFSIPRTSSCGNGNHFGPLSSRILPTSRPVPITTTERERLRASATRSASVSEGDPCNCTLSIPAAVSVCTTVAA